MCAAYINPFDSPYYEHPGVDNTYFFDAIEGILLDVDGCEIILCGDFNARTADRSCLTISFDENDAEDIVFEHDRWSQDTKTNGFGDKLLELGYSLEITILNGLFNRKGEEFTFVNLIAERIESKHNVCTNGSI